MATLEDKILGEKTHYYCSSSESEHSDDEKEDDRTSAAEEVSPELPPVNADGSANTGPKGVIKDWQRFKQLETEKRAEQEKERIKLMQKLSITCRSSLEEDNDAELDELSDEFLEEYRKKRMKEMLAVASDLPKFGSVINIENKDVFLDAVDKENKQVTVIIHLYEDKAAGCKLMNQALESLSKSYQNVKFCKIKASVAGVSKQFKISGVPALLVYKTGQLVGNYVKLTNELGDDFSSDDVESFLIEVGMLQDRTCVPRIIQEAEAACDDSD